MKPFGRTLLCFTFAVFYFFVSHVAARGENYPLALYLTLFNDPLTEITVNWHTKLDNATPVIEYRVKGARVWQVHEGYSLNFPHTDRFIHRNKLINLKPGTVYEFRIKGNNKTYTFRTLPATLNDSLIFVTGGDVQHSRTLMDATNKAAAAVSPYFVAFGGDLAYADGLPERVSRWFTFFDSWYETMITPEGYLIPIVAGIGNHEVIGSFSNNPENATFFFDLFGIPDKTAYYAMHAGDYLSLIMLDTDHTTPITGKQTQWLRQVLINNRNKKHIFPVYHVTAYPSHRDFNNPRSEVIRKYWVPLFETYGVKIAFENHDHTFKRTHPLKQNKVHPDGITYIGDGAWGVSTRVPVNIWYLDKTAAERHFLKVRITNNLANVTAIKPNGEILDEFSKTFAKPTTFTQDIFPGETRLRQNFPNPFNPSTAIPIQLTNREFVTVDIFDVRGRKIKTLFNDYMVAGNHSIAFMPEGLPSGTYICRVRAGNYTNTIKMMYIK